MDNYPNDCIVYYLDTVKLLASRMQYRISKIDAQINSVQEDIVLLSVTQMALSKIEAILKEMRGLAVEAANNPDTNRENLNSSFVEMKKEIERVINSADYKGVNLLDGSLGEFDALISALNDTADA